MRTDLDAAPPIPLGTAFTGTSKMHNFTRLLSILALSVSIPFAYAHDPKEHAKETAEAGPNCAAIHDMDHSKMDPNDPVMKAMMDKCAAVDHTGMDTDHGATTQPTPGTAATSHDHGSH